MKLLRMQLYFLEKQHSTWKWL